MGGSPPTFPVEAADTVAFADGQAPGQPGPTFTGVGETPRQPDLRKTTARIAGEVPVPATVVRQSSVPVAVAPAKTTDIGVPFVIKGQVRHAELAPVARPPAIAPPARPIPEKPELAVTR